MVPDSDVKPLVPLVEDRNRSQDGAIEIVEPSKTELVSANVSDQGEETVYALSVPSDIPVVENAETLLNDFKDYKSMHSSVPLSLDLDGDKNVEHRSMVDTFQVKTANQITQGSQISENCESTLESAVSEYTNTAFSAFVPALVIDEDKVPEILPLKTSEIVTESEDSLSEAEVSLVNHPVVTLSERKDVSEFEHAPEVIKKEIGNSVLVLTETYTQEIVKEPRSGTESDQKIGENVVTDFNKCKKVDISERSEKTVVEKSEESHNASGVVSETVVNEGDAKLTSSQDCGVDASVGSSSRNSLEGNWGSVSVLSTASVDAFGGPSLVESKKEIDQNASEIKAVATQNSHPPRSEDNNETEGRKRNEEAIAKVTNWTTNEQIPTPIKNLATEAKASNLIQLSTMIQKDEAAEKTDEPKKSNILLGTTTANQEPSPPKYIGEGKKVGKKAKGISSWVPFMCCSSVNAS